MKGIAGPTKQSQTRRRFVQMTRGVSQRARGLALPPSLLARFRQTCRTLRGFRGRTFEFHPEDKKPSDEVLTFRTHFGFLELSIYRLSSSIHVFSSFVSSRRVLRYTVPNQHMNQNHIFLNFSVVDWFGLGH